MDDDYFKLVEDAVKDNGIFINLVIMDYWDGEECSKIIIGDDFDSTKCHADLMIVTKDKKQHGKILKVKSFAIRNTYNNVMQKKANVEICVFSKKHKAGEVLIYSAEHFI